MPPGAGPRARPRLPTPGTRHPLHLAELALDGALAAAARPLVGPAGAGARAGRLALALAVDLLADLLQGLAERLLLALQQREVGVRVVERGTQVVDLGLDLAAQLGRDLLAVLAQRPLGGVGE